MLDICFDFERRASAVLQLRFRGREAILNRTQSQNMSDISKKKSQINGRTLLKIGLAEPKIILKQFYLNLIEKLRKKSAQ